MSGGIAALIGAATGRATYTFNAAGLHSNTMAEYGVTVDATMQFVSNSYVSGEILTLGQKLTPLPDAVGKQRAFSPDISWEDRKSYLKAANEAAKRAGPGRGLAVIGAYAVARAADLHRISEMIEAIAKEMEAQGCD